MSDRALFIFWGSVIVIVITILLQFLLSQECETGKVEVCISYDHPYSDEPVVGSKKCMPHGKWGSCHALPPKKIESE